MSVTNTHCDLLDANFPGLTFQNKTACCTTPVTVAADKRFHLTCTPDGNITAIECPECGLSLSLASLASLSRIRSLEVLDLRANNVSGVFHESWRDFGPRGLKRILLRSNPLGSTFEAFLARLPTPVNLESLGVLPRSFGNLVNLEKLSISDNILTGELPASLGNLTKLALLDLRNNGFSGPIPVGLTKISSLNFLLLSNNGFVGSIPEFGRSMSLNFLQLSANNLSGPIPESIGNARNLQYLYVSNNKINGKIPETIGNLNNLVRWDFSSNNISGQLPSTIANMTSLVSMILTDNSIDGTIPNAIGGLRELLAIDLSFNKIRGGLASLLNSSSLVQLDLRNNNISEPFAVFESFPRQLVNLNLSGNCFEGDLPNTLNSFRLYLEPQFNNCTTKPLVLNGTGSLGESTSTSTRSFPLVLAVVVGVVGFLAIVLFASAIAVVWNARRRKTRMAAARAQRETEEMAKAGFFVYKNGLMEDHEDFANSISERTPTGGDSYSAILETYTSQVSPARRPGSPGFETTPSIYRHAMPPHLFSQAPELPSIHPASTISLPSQPPSAANATNSNSNESSHPYDAFYDNEPHRSPSPVLSIRKEKKDTMPDSQIVELLLEGDPVVEPVIDADAVAAVGERGFRTPIPSLPPPSFLTAVGGGSSFIGMGLGLGSGEGTSRETRRHGIQVAPMPVGAAVDAPPVPSPRFDSKAPMISLPTSMTSTFYQLPRRPHEAAAAAGPRSVSEGVGPVVGAAGGGRSGSRDAVLPSSASAVESRGAPSTRHSGGAVDGNGQYLRFRDHPWTWTVRQVAEYLVRLGHPMPVVKTFIDNHIDGRAFLHLTDADMYEELAIRHDDLRYSLLHAIHLLRISESLPQDDTGSFDFGSMAGGGSPARSLPRSERRWGSLEREERGVVGGETLPSPAAAMPVLAPAAEPGEVGEDGAVMADADATLTRRRAMLIERIPQLDAL
ncbi:hypothetical protein HDU96_000348 [Phlyctochytrium bullatum]|nr:hypothetical protein HDU96_000348 [Phlyctochytrium bullatum]